MYPYTYPEFNVMYRSSMKEAVDFIKDSIQDQYGNIRLYETIIFLADSPEEKSIIDSMIIDEKNHIHILKNLYKEITGMSFVPEDKLASVPDKFKNAVKLAVRSEAESVDACSRVYDSIEELRYKSVVQKIINDELKHLQLLNFLLISDL